ncbi:MAG: hypothetical protein J6C13_02695 [Clostridia bacterium]|nr:hypothetical protein [Clostridia bacterium]
MKKIKNPLEKKLEDVQALIKFYNNSSKVYLQILKDVDVNNEIFYKSRLAEYETGLVLLKELEENVTKELEKVKSSLFLKYFENIDYSSIQLSEAEEAEVKKEVRNVMKMFGYNTVSSYSQLIDRYTYIKKMQKLKKQVEEKTEEMKDEYQVQLDKLSKEGELDLQKDENQLYLDSLTREGNEVQREIFVASQDNAEEVKTTIKERKKKSQLLLDIEAVYAEEMERY